MNWTQVDIYTATPAIDLLSVRLQDLGIIFAKLYC